MEDRIRNLIEKANGELYTGFGGSPDIVNFTEDQLETFIDVIAQEHESQLAEAENQWQKEALVALQTAKSALGSCPEKGQIKMAREVVDALLGEELVMSDPYPHLEPWEAYETACKHLAELKSELAKAKREADSLATTLWRRYYRNTSNPKLELSDTVNGVISQIDNMVASIVTRLDDVTAENQQLSMTFRSHRGDLRILYKALAGEENE